MGITKDELITKADLDQLRVEMNGQFGQLRELLERSLSPDDWLYARDAMRYTHLTTEAGFRQWAEKNNIEFIYTGETGTTRKWRKSQILQCRNNKLREVY